MEDRTLLSAPTFSPDTYTFSVDEDAPTSALVGSVQANDADFDPLQYSIVSGDPDSVFSIDSMGQISVMGELDYEATASYSLTVEVSDGFESDTATVTVNVNDVAEAPVFDPDSYSFSVDETAESGTVVGTLSASDPQGDFLTYSIVSGDPESVFSIDSMGQLTVQGELDYESQANYTLTVEVSDGNETDTATVTVSINDVAEAPVFNPDSYSFSVDETAESGNVVGTLSASDPQGDFLTYSIVSGDPESVFSVDSSGQLIVQGELDYESQSSYTLTVEVSDGNETDTATVTVNVNNVNEAPVITSFVAIEGPNNSWTFEGTVEDQDGNLGSITIVFGGILDGYTTTVELDGTFSFSIVLGPEDEGEVTATAIDSGGLESEEPASDFVIFS